MVSYVVSVRQANRIELNRIKSATADKHTEAFPFPIFVPVYVYHYFNKKMRVNHFPFVTFSTST